MSDRNYTEEALLLVLAALQGDKRTQASWAASIWNAMIRETALRLRLEALVSELEQHIQLAEHKIDQHLQGQYNEPPYEALGVALSECRAALIKAAETPKEEL